MREESNDLVPVIGNRGFTHPALLCKIFHEGVFQSRLRIPCQTRSRRRHGAGLPEMGKELLQHRAIASPQATSVSRAIAAERGEPSFIYLRDAQAVSIQPAVEVAKQPELIPGVDPAIPLLEEQSREPVDMASQWPTPETPDGPRVLEEVRRH